MGDGRHWRVTGKVPPSLALGSLPPPQTAMAATSHCKKLLPPPTVANFGPLHFPARMIGGRRKASSRVYANKANRDTKSGTLEWAARTAPPSPRRPFYRANFGMLEGRRRSLFGAPRLVAARLVCNIRRRDGKRAGWGAPTSSLTRSSKQPVRACRPSSPTDRPRRTPTWTGGVISLPDDFF